MTEEPDPGRPTAKDLYVGIGVVAVIVGLLVARQDRDSGPIIGVGGATALVVIPVIAVLGGALVFFARRSRDPSQAVIPVVLVAAVVLVLLLRSLR
jgi:hypothetical protein